MAATFSRMRQNVQEAFNERGVEIMSLHYTSLRDTKETAIPAPYRRADHRG